MKKILKNIFILAIIILGIMVVMRKIYPLNHEAIISDSASEYNLKESFIAAIIKTESGFNTFAKSYKGARGLMQIMPETGDWIAEMLQEPNDELMLYDPEINIRFGTWYIASLIERYDNVDTALAAYNAGSGNVDEWLKNEKYSKDGKTLIKIPFKETDKYIIKVRRNRLIYEIMY